MFPVRSNTMHMYMGLWTVLAYRKLLKPCSYVTVLISKCDRNQNCWLKSKKGFFITPCYWDKILDFFPLLGFS